MKDSEDIGQYSRELQTLNKIDRFGVYAVMGRPSLYVGEMTRMILAENIYTAYVARKKSGKTWAEWANDNPVMSSVLNSILIEDSK